MRRRRPCSLTIGAGLWLCAALLVVLPVASHDLGVEPQAIRVDGVDAAAAERLEQAGFDLAFRGSGYVEVLARPGDTARLAELGYAWKPLERDLFAGARAGSDEGNLDPQYHTYQEMLDELTQLAVDYPGICRLVDIGDAQSRSWWWDNFTYEYDIWALRISDNPAIDEPEPCIVYDGRHHAREPVATEISLAVARHFCQNYGVLPEITQVVNATEIWIVPMLNPDGHQWVQEIDPWWRKNLFDYDEDHHVDSSEGIDLNRNYDWHWIASSWSSETYGGPYPFQAPETQALRDLCLVHRPAINPTFHSYGQVVMYPFGYGVTAEPAVVQVAQEYASRIGYGPEQSTTANGSSKDYFYGVIGTAGFTVETATSFIPSGAAMLAEVQQILPGSIWLAQRLLGPSIQGTVIDSVAGVPLEATIHIPEIMEVYGNGELHDMVTEAATGYFCRMRPAAQQTITLQVSAAGYYDKTLQVTTGGTTATVVEIKLVPESFERGIVQGTVTNATAGGTPVANAQVSVLGAATTLYTNAQGFYSCYVDPGNYLIAVSHASFAPDTAGPVPVVVGEITAVSFALDDIAAPAISNTTHYPNTDDTVGPYEISTTITDQSALTERLLFYRVLGQTWQTLTLAPTGLDHYAAAIPGQPLGSTVQYYIRSEDEGGNAATDPSGAPSETYTFRIAPYLTVFEDAMEGGAGDWQHYVGTGGYSDQWHLSTQRNHTTGGLSAWKCGVVGTGSYGSLLDAVLESPAFTLGESGVLSFWHWIDAEDSSTYPTQAYDGGRVEISVEGGAWEPITPVGGYTHTIRASSQPGPFPAGTPVFSGTFDWTAVEFDLSAYDGSEVRLRFRFGSDGNTGGEGWYIDDLIVRSMMAAAVGEPEVAATLRCTRLLCSPSPCRAGAGAQVHYTITRPEAVRLRVFDAAGRQVSSLSPARPAAEGLLQWNGCDEAGRPLGSGLYLMRLEVGDHGLAERKLVVLGR